MTDAPLQALTGTMALPLWLQLFLVWTNGIMLTALGAVILRNRDILALRGKIDQDVTGVRSAIRAEIDLKLTQREQTIGLHGTLIEKLSREVFGTNSDGEGGILKKLDEMSVGQNALISLFVRHGEKMGIDVEDLRNLEAHR